MSVDGRSKERARRFADECRNAVRGAGTAVFFAERGTQIVCLSILVKGSLFLVSYLGGLVPTEQKNGSKELMEEICNFLKSAGGYYFGFAEWNQLHISLKENRMFGRRRKNIEKSVAANLVYSTKNAL